jgi:hypothetical protein
VPCDSWAPGVRESTVSGPGSRQDARPRCRNDGAGDGTHAQRASMGGATVRPRSGGHSGRGRRARRPGPVARGPRRGQSVVASSRNVARSRSMSASVVR